MSCSLDTHTYASAGDRTLVVRVADGDGGTDTVSVALTVDPTRRAQRALAAAEASLQAGAFDATRALLATADAGPLDEPGRARLDLVRGNLAFVSGRSRESPTSSR